MEGDSSGLLSGDPGRGRPSYETGTGSYMDRGRSTTSRLMQLAFVAIVIIMVLITLILSIYRAATVGGAAGIYILLGFSLLGFVAVEVVMVQFVRKGDLPQEKTWFLYFVGGCVVLEAIFTDILLFQ